MPASHNDRCLTSDNPSFPSFIALNAPHGDSRAADARSRSESSSHARCSCISASSSFARSSGEITGRTPVLVGWLFVGFLILAVRECAGQDLEVEAQPIQEPAHGSEFVG